MVMIMMQTLILTELYSYAANSHCVHGRYTASCHHGRNTVKALEVYCETYIPPIDGPQFMKYTRFLCISTNVLPPVPNTNSLSLHAFQGPKFGRQVV